MLSFLAGHLVAFVPFGLAPVLTGRVRSGARNKISGGAELGHEMLSPDDLEKALNESLEHWKAMLDKILALQDMHFTVLPPSLHHYGRGRANAISILKHRELWAFHAYDMGDPKEIWHGAEIVKQRVAVFRERYAHQSAVVDKFLNIMDEVINPFTSEWSGDNDVFLLCFTESDRSEFHWKRYAKEHTGHCLSFKTDASQWREVMDRSNVMLIKVTYDEQAQIQLIDDVLESSVSYIVKAQFDDYPFGSNILGSELGPAVVAAEVLKYLIVSFKRGEGCDEDFTPENEWRLVHGIKTVPGTFPVNVLRNDGDERKYVRLPFEGIGPLLAPTGILVGKAATRSEQMRFESLEQRYFHESKLPKICT